MKKIVKIIFGVLLVLGCSCGVLLDNSGMFVKSVWAIEYSLGGKTTVTGSTVKQISCTEKNGKKRVFVVNEDGDFFSVDDYPSTDSCTSIVSSIKNEMSRKGFITEGVVVHAETDGKTPASSSGSAGGSPSSNGGNSSDSKSSGGGAPKMNVLTMCQDREGKEAIGCVLNLVVNIMTYGIGVLGVVGIVLSGIQYITSQGDPAKMTKAKNRIVQVVIGLVIYAVMYAALVFLVPGFSTNIT